MDETERLTTRPAQLLGRIQALEGVIETMITLMPDPALWQIAQDVEYKRRFSQTPKQTDFERDLAAGALEWLTPLKDMITEEQAARSEGAKFSGIEPTPEARLKWRQIQEYDPSAD